MDVLITGDQDYSNKEVITSQLKDLSKGEVTYNNVILIDNTSPATFVLEEALKYYLGILRLDKVLAAEEGTEAKKIDLAISLGRPDEVWVFTEDAIKSEYCKRILFHAHRNQIPTRVFH